MSLFNRKPRGKSRYRKTRTAPADLASSLFPGPLPRPAFVPILPAASRQAPARHPPRRRHRPASYVASRPRQPMFRVT